MARYGSKPEDRWPPGDKQGGRFRPRTGGAPDPVKARPKQAARPSTRSQPSPPPAPSVTPGPGLSQRWEQVRKQLRALPLEKLADTWRDVTLMPAGPGRDRALAELDAELARRDGKATLTVEDTPHSRQIDDLLARGWSYTDAYAEVHHLDPDKLRAEEREQVIRANRRPGERRVQTLRRMYAEHVYLQYLDAEEATRGNMFSPAGRARDQALRAKGGAGLDPASLWSGPTARARRYASEELKRWWEEHGGRQPFTVWSAAWAGDRKTVQAHRQRGAGKDFGL